MKDNSSIALVSIKTNADILSVLKKNKKVNLPIGTIWLSYSNNKSQIEYALLVNKSNFKLAVTRNKIKRQLRNILIQSNFKGGIKLLIKPNPVYLKKDYQTIKELIIKTITKYQNGK